MTETRERPDYLDENGNAYLQFHSTALPPNLDGDYMLEFIGHDAGQQSSSHPNMFYTGWFCKPSWGDEYWAMVVEDGSMSWINLFAEEEDSPADWYDSTERVGDHWTVHRSAHVSDINHPVVIVRIDEGWHPFEERPYAVLFQNPNDGGSYQGSYDLTLEQALEERQRRSV